MLAVRKAQCETPAVRFSTPEDVLLTLMRISTMIGCPPPNPTEFNILNDELRATQETLNITTGEIVLAYRLAISGTLDHRPADLITYGQPLTIFHMVRVVQSYRRWKLQQQALIGAPVEDARQPSREERIQIMINGARRAWDTFKGTLEIIDYGGAVHNFLFINRFFERDADDIRDIKEAALAEYRAGLVETTGKTPFDIKVTRQVLNEILAGVTRPDVEAQLKTIRRRLSLKMYFEELLFSEQELGALLDQKPITDYKLNATDNERTTDSERD